jgi:lipoprotein-anchoring transpeptidase ErfK/SrfK
MLGRAVPLARGVLLPLALAAVVLTPPTGARGARSEQGARGFASTAAWDERIPRRPATVPSAASSRAAHVRAMLVRIAHDLAITSKPGGGRVVGIMPSRSKFLGTPIVASVIERSSGGRYGRVPLPYGGSAATGWISLKGLARTFTPYSVRADLSRHLLTVFKLGRRVARFPVATGAATSPTPPGRYFVTDRVAVYAGSPFGSFAFGLSGIQTNLPPGWSGGGDQLAIHGTNDPSSIGRSASAGCLRVSEAALRWLEPILRLGTPVDVEH